MFSIRKISSFHLYLLKLFSVFRGNTKPLPVVPVAVDAKMAGRADRNQITEIVLFVEQMLICAVVHGKLRLVFRPSAAAAAVSVTLHNLLRYLFPFFRPDILLVLTVQFLFLLRFLSHNHFTCFLISWRLWADLYRALLQSLLLSCLRYRVRTPFPLLYPFRS